MNQTTTAEQNAFYEAAVLALRGLDVLRIGQPRLDDEAMARWRQFKGELLDADLLDLLVRDAAVAQPAGFAPRVVFALPGLAEDDPFGAEWPGVEAGLAARLLRMELMEFDLASALHHAAALWHLHPGALHSPLPELTPSTRLLVSGVGALLAVAQAFLQDHSRTRSGFDFADQVIVVTERPGERQLAGLTAALLRSAKPLHVRLPAEARGLKASAVVSSTDAGAAAVRALNDYRAAAGL